MRGPLFLSFEGIDGSGKTTQVGKLVEFLEGLGRPVRVFREPGGTELGEGIRELVLGGGDIAPWAEVCLFAAARAQLVDKAIRPALEAGSDVVCDRYLDSSVAYQGLGRGLGEDAVFDWNLRVSGGLLPALTFVLELSAEDARARISGDPALAGEPCVRTTPDRLEREPLAFWQRVEDAYRSLALHSPGRVIALDATLPAATIAERVARSVNSLLSGEPLAAR